MINIFNKKKVFIVLTISVALMASIFWFVYQQKQIENQPSPTTPVIQKQEPKEESDFKIYHNEEWGFEFWYPEDWILRENIFGSYYSKFNLDIVVKKRDLI